jgi:hypothetical protein
VRAAGSGRRFARTFAAAVLLAAIPLAIAKPAAAWDSRTHRLIASLAIDALPQSPLKDAFESGKAALQEYAVEPDTVLKPEYGRAEEIHHYIDLENFGPNPFAQLSPDFTVMEQRFGARTLERSGTLPWTIGADASRLAAQWRDRDCDAMFRTAGYLAHYVGDASMPLHSTKYYDGETYSDRGMHSRFEGAADHDVREIEAAARPQVHIEQIDSVWTPVIAEIRRANALVPEVMQSDRVAHSQNGRDRRGYDQTLMAADSPMVARQVADAASVLAAIWLYEWKQAGSPAACPDAPPVAPRHRWRGRRGFRSSRANGINYGNGLVDSTSR